MLTRYLIPYEIFKNNQPKYYNNNYEIYFSVMINLVRHKWNLCDVIDDKLNKNKL